MKSYHKELWLQIPARMDFINITSDVERALQESGIQEGLCLVNAMPPPSPVRNDFYYRLTQDDFVKPGDLQLSRRVHFGTNDVHNAAIVIWSAFKIVMMISTTSVEGNGTVTQH